MLAFAVKAARGQVVDYSLYGEDEDLPFFIDEPENITTRVDEKVILKCRIGNTQDKSAQWTRNGFGLGQERALNDWPNLRMIGHNKKSKTSIYFTHLPLEINCC